MSNQAVCLLLPFNTGYLVVSRRNDPTQWGLPGGKVDPGETLHEAVFREVWEETGICVAVSSLREVYSGWCLGGTPYLTTTFTLTGDNDYDLSECGTEPGLTLAVATKATLCDDAQSPFAAYNKRLFAALEREC